MRDIIIEIVRHFPAMLAAFGAIMRWGEDDDERLATLESTVNDLREKLREISAHIEAKKHERLS